MREIGWAGKTGIHFNRRNTSHLKTQGKHEFLWSTLKVKEDTINYYFETTNKASMAQVG